jgi:formate hydrogenlyase subunit 3/multisubunit Na+/H+ antiporter MnhD subunit
MIGVTVHALAKALLFASVSAAEVDGPVTLDTRGLAARYPIAGAGFVLGALAILGVPPTMGFIAHWRLYGAAAQVDGWLLVAMLLATALAVLAYARVIAWCWWGPGGTERRREPVGLAAAVIGLSLILIVLGLGPSLITGG